MAIKLMEKQLTSTDLTSCLAYPTAILWAFPMVQGQNTMWFKAKDPYGRVWNLKLCTRNSGRHDKPVIRGEWLEYVRERGLTVRDVIVLTMEYDIENGVMSYNIQIEPSFELAM